MFQKGNIISLNLANLKRDAEITLVTTIETL